MRSLKKLAIQPTGTMVVRDAAGNVVTNEDDGSTWSITFHSPGTKQFQKAYHAFNEKKSGGLAAIVKGQSEKKDPAQDTNDLAEFLAAVTISFNNFDYEGKVGHPAYLAAYKDIEVGHIAEQANKFLGDRGNFWTPPVTTSPSPSDTQPG